MTFSDSVSSCFYGYARFSGRASRSEYWWFWLFCAISGFFVGIISGLLAISVAPWLGHISNLYSLFLILPSIAVGVRRCHDSGRSGWWIICPIYNLVLMFWPSDEDANEYGEPED